MTASDLVMLTVLGPV